MFKTKKGKIIIGAVVVLAVLIASSIWVTSSFQKEDVDNFSYTTLASTDLESTTSLTQIDHIIQEADPYNVLIITSDSTDASDVKDFFERQNTGFTKYVVNDYRTIDATMEDGKVSVTIKTASSYTGMSKSEITDTLGSADLLFLYGSSSTSFTGTSAISEDLYECLRNYVSGGKPMILSCDGLNGSTDVVTETGSGYDSNVWSMTTKDFKNSWKRTKTTNISGWTYETESGNGDGEVQSVIESYMSSTRSTYVSYALNNLTVPSGYTDWQSYWKRVDGTSTLNVLYIYGGDEADSSSLENEKADIQAVAEWMIGDGKTSVFNTLDGTMLPENVKVTAVCAKDLKAYDADNQEQSLYVDSNKTKKQYDYIFIAPDKYSPTYDMAQDTINELEKISASTEGYTYILFGTLEGKSVTTSSSTGTNKSVSFDTSTNFGKIVDLYVTTTGYAKKSNVLPVDTSYMKTLASNPDSNPSKVSDVVSLINKSTYKTYAGSGSGAASGSVSTTAYRVLELQPCYPIDLEMALSSTVKTNVNSTNGTNGIGNYYTVPADVLNTSELDNYTDEDGNMTSEYYQWDLTKAKLAYALNISADQIELVQMSTEEFITSKADVTNSYDLIYIGGNKSAKKISTLMNNYPYNASDSQLLEAIKTGSGLPAVTPTTNTASYSMYTHTGEITSLVSGQTFNFAREYASTTLNGNDITYDRLTALEEYIDADMPIVFSNEIWTAYEQAKKLGYSNTLIDPDSNMYALLAYAEENNAGLQGWEIKEKYSGNSAYADYLTEYYVMDGTTQRVENTTGVYGSASKVTVFNDDLSDNLYGYVYSADMNIRPKFTIDTNAVEYSDSDSSTQLTTHDLTWEITLQNEIAGHVYRAVLLIDEDDNAEFSLSGETAGSVVTFSGGTATLTYHYDDDDFGAFSWKVLVADATGSSSAGISEDMPSRGYSAITMIQRTEEQAKKSARILEIMPLNSTTNGGQDGHTLYLDSNIQQGQGTWKFKYSSYLKTEGTVTHTTDGSGNDVAKVTSLGTADDSYVCGYEPHTNSTGQYYKYESVSFVNQWDASASKSSLGGLALGLYQPQLSLNRYDTSGNYEDWTYNYVDSISDDYDVSLDIMYVDDLEYYSTRTRELTDAQREDYSLLAEAAKAEYDAYLTEGTTQYTELYAAEKALKDALTEIKDGTFSMSVQNQYNASVMDTYTASSFDTTDLEGIIDSGYYFRFFFENTGWNTAVVQFHKKYYVPYTTVHNKMVDAYRKYIHYSLLAYGPEEYLSENFDVIVIGFYDDANGEFVDFSENASADIESFYLADGSILMTHDNMTKDMTKGSVNLTTTLRSYCGMERFGEVSIQSGTENASIPHYLTTNTNKYFFTNLSLITGGETGKTAAKKLASEWKSLISNFVTSRGGIASTGSSTYSFGYPGFTDCFIVYETNQAAALPYLYSEFQIEEQIKWNLGTGKLKVTGTTKAVQVNRGVVTTYPYYVDSDLRISPTHNQAYGLDLENDKVTVWYTMAADNLDSSGKTGSTSYQSMKENSSLYAASPKDGADSYFIYSVGNITYCGAGHSLVTGDGRDNNDERKLFLNVLVNMAKKSTKQETSDIVLYDPDRVTSVDSGNSKIVKYSAEDGYYINVSSSIEYPEFAFEVKKKQGQTIESVQVFYDLDYDISAEDSDTYVNNDKHVLVTLPEDIIYELNNGTVYALTKEACPLLITQRSYFDAYDGHYTYLVVRVQMTDGTVLTKRIKIKLTRDMLDLT